MGTLIVPPFDEEPWPTIGPQVVAFLQERAIYGPGSLKGEPYVVDDEFEAQIYRMFEVYPQGHRLAGRRRFKRVGISCRKGLAKTEKMALIAYVELHPEGPARCDGFDASGEPVARPVRDPYIPMLAVTQEQVEELAYGALKVICEEGPDAEFFDVSLERILRLDEWGRADGKAVPLSNSPGSRDGARTTLNCFDEPHRLSLPRALAAHETMVANLSKRVLEDPWGLYVGTAGELGEGSVAEGLHNEAEQIRDGLIDDPALAYFHRDASPTNPRTGKAYDMDSLAERIEAVVEATGAVGEFGPGQFEDIAKQWDRPAADRNYLERVWLNRWTKSNQQAFDVGAWSALGGHPIPDGALVTVGFDGARLRDATGFVLTDVMTGRQRLFAGWEKPLDDDEWEVPISEVYAAENEIHERYEVFKAYGDPPHWIETLGEWAGKRPGIWEEWWTNRPKQMSYAVRAYIEAIASGSVTHEVGRDTAEDGPEARFAKHIAAAGRKDINLYDDEGRRLFVLKKLHEDRKFDYAMAAVLSWQARLDALAKGAAPRKKKTATIIRAR
ncbi:MAG: large terminase [Mycobacteriaceae bacterium]